MTRILIPLSVIMPIVLIASCTEQTSEGDPASAGQEAHAPTSLADQGFALQTGSQIDIFVGLTSAESQAVQSAHGSAESYEGIQHKFWRIRGTVEEFSKLPLATDVPLNQLALSFAGNIRLPANPDLGLAHRLRFMEFAAWDQPDCFVRVEHFDPESLDEIRIAWHGKLFFQIPEEPNANMYLHQNKDISVPIVTP